MTIVKNGVTVKEFIPTSFTDIIDNIFKDSVTNSPLLKFLPKVDIAEDDKKYEIHLAVPGVPKDAIKIDLHDGRLIVSGERKLEKSEDEKKYYTIETQYGSFQRSFLLPEKANAEEIAAEFINGILKIVIPKDEKKLLKTSINIK